MPFALPLAPTDPNVDNMDPNAEGMPPATPPMPGQQPASPPVVSALPLPDRGMVLRTPDEDAEGGTAKGRSRGGLGFYDALVAQRKAEEQAQRDRFDPSKVTVDKDHPGFIAPERPHDNPWYGDFARQTWVHTESLGQAALGLASFTASQLGADPETVQHIENKRAQLADNMKSWVDSMSPNAKKAMRASMFGGHDAEGELPGIGDVGFGNYLSATIASLVPTAVMAMVPGGVVAAAVRKTAMSALSTAALGEAVGASGAGLAGGLAGAATTGSLFAAQGAGDTYNNLADALFAAKPEDLAKDPSYSSLIQRGYTDTQARQQILQTVAPQFVAMAASVNGLSGVGLGGLMVKGPMAAKGRSALGRAMIGGAEGGVTMGGQAGGDEAINQYAQRAAGVKPEIDSGEIALAAAKGFVGGALMTGPPAMWHGRGKGPDKGIPHVPSETAAPPPPDLSTLSEAPPPAAPPPAPPPEIRGGPEAGGPMPPSGTDPRTSEQANWPHPNAELQPAPQWPHPMDETGGATGETATALPPQQVPGRTFPGPFPENTGVEAGATVPHPPTTARTPEQASWPHPNVEEGAVSGAWPHPLDEAPMVASALSEQRPTPPPEPAPAQAPPAWPHPQDETPDQAGARAPETTPVAQQAGPAPGLGETPTKGGTPPPPESRGGVGAPGSPPVAPTPRKGGGGAAAPTTGVTTPEKLGKGADIGGMGGGILHNMHEMLWGKIQQGDTTEAGGPSNFLRAAKAVRDAGGLQTRAQYDAFAKDMGKALATKGAGKEQAVREAMARHLPEAKAAAEGKAVSASTPEPAGDIAAQLRALADPAHPKDAVFVAKGTKMPEWPTKDGKMPDGIKAVPRREGVLFTTDKAKADAFRKGKLDDARIAEILGMAQTKAEVVQHTLKTGEPPVVVQAKDKTGAVVHETLSTPAKAAAEAEALKGHGTVETVTPEQMQARRAGQIAAEPVVPTTEVKKTARQLEKERLAGVKQEVGETTGAGKLALKGDVAKEARAKLAQAGERTRMKGEVVTGEAEGKPIAEREHVGRTFDEARTEAVSALHDVGHDIVQPLRAGDLGKIMNGLARELQAVIEARAGKNPSEQSVHEAIADWGRGKGNEPIALTTTRRHEIADAVLKKLTGEGLRRDPALEQARKADLKEVREGDRERRAADLKGEKDRESSDEAVHAEKAVAEGEGARGKGEEPSELTEAGHLSPDDEVISGSEGVQDYGANAGPTKERKAKEHKARVLGDLIEEVKQGTKTVHEVAAEYGEQKKEGRKRNFGNFGDYLDHLIKEARKPEQSVIDLANEYNKKLTTGKDGQPKAVSPQARTELHKKIARLLDNTGEEAAQRFEEMKRELLDPVGAAADAAERDRALETNLRQATTGSKPADPFLSRYVKMAGEPRVNREITEKIRAIDQTGLPGSARDFLDTVLKSSLWQNELPVLHQLARILKKNVRDVDIITPKYADEHGLAYTERAYGEQVPHSYKKNFEGAREYIVLHPEQTWEHGLGHGVVAIHEILHTLTSHFLEQDAARGGHSTKVLGAISKELGRWHATGEGNSTERDLVRLATGKNAELHTMFLSEPAFQAVTAKIKVSPWFVETMNALGYDLKPQTTLWQAFTNFARKALGLAKPKDAADASLFEHILRPMQDIVGKAAEFNKENVTQHGALRDVSYREKLGSSSTLTNYRSKVGDPGVAADGEKFLRAVGGDGGRGGTRAELWSKAVGKWGDLTNGGRSALLTAGTSDAIHDIYKPLYDVKPDSKQAKRIKVSANPLSDFRAANEAIANTAKKIHDTLGGAASRLFPKINGPEVGALRNDATLADVRLGRDKSKLDNSHLSEEGKKLLPELQKRFDKLTPEQQEGYEQELAIHRNMRTTEHQAKLKAMAQEILPDATPEQVDTLAAVLRSKGRTDDFIKTGESDALARAFGKAWDDPENRKIIREIARVHNVGFVKGDYFPLRRNGDYVVNYGSEENPGTEFFKTQSEAEARAKELRAAGEEVRGHVDLKRQRAQDFGAAAPLMHMLATRAEKNPKLRPLSRELNDMIASTMLEANLRSERMRSKLRREGVRGASTNAPQVLAQEVIAHGERMGHIVHGGARQEALRQMGMVADDLAVHGKEGDAIKARMVMREMEKRIATGDSMGGTMSGIARKASSMAFVKSLLSPSHMLIESMQAHGNATAIIGGRHGFGRTSLALGKALMDIAPKMGGRGIALTGKSLQGLEASDWNLAHHARDQLIKAGANAEHMKQLFGGLDDANLIDHSYARDIKRIANEGLEGKGKVANGWQRFMDFNGIGAHAVDVMNKSAIAKAAFDLEMRKTGGDVAKSVEFGKQAVRDAIPNWNLSNKPRLATAAGPLGALAAPIMQFKLYGLHMYGVMTKLAKASMRGATPEQKREAAKQMAGLLVTHSLMAGALTTIADPLRYIGGAYDWLEGRDKPKDYQAAIRGWLSDHMGPTFAEIFARGLPHAIGMDAQHRAGFGDMLAVPPLESYDKKGVAKMLGTAMTGAAGDDAGSLFQGATKIVQGLHGGDIGTLWGGFQDLAPRVISDAVKAGNLAVHGVTDTTGKTILPSSKLSPWDIGLQAAGIQPSKVSEFREGRQAVTEARREVSDESHKLSNAWLSADPKGRASIQTKIMEFNREHPNEPIKIATLFKTLQTRQTELTQPDRFGLRLPKKSGGDYTPAGRFATR